MALNFVAGITKQVSPFIESSIKGESNHKKEDKP